MFNKLYRPESNPSIRLSVCLAVLLVGIAINLPVPLYARYADLSGMGGKAFGAAFACYGMGSCRPYFFLVAFRIWAGDCLSFSLLPSALSRSCLSPFFLVCQRLPSHEWSKELQLA